MPPDPSPAPPSRREVLRLLAAGVAGVAGATSLTGCRAGAIELAGARELLAADVPPASSSAAVPAAFVGHGSPMTVLDPVRGAIWTRWAESMPRPRAILAVSAHFEERPLTIGATTRVPLLYDYSGFPAAMYAVRYDAPPAPALADRVEALLAGAVRTVRDPRRGLDHGSFVPLRWLHPAADVPVLTISMPTEDGPALFALGRALAPLRREGVLVLGSGNVTHNLGRTGGVGSPPSWATDFDAWTADVLGRGDVDALVDFRAKAPALRLAHPTLDHWLPLLVVAGAAEGASATFPLTGWKGGSISRRCVQIG